MGSGSDPKGNEAEAARRARLAAALRDNLKRRKAQARARSADARETAEPAAPAPAADPDKD